MNDTEKLSLISKMIADFLGYSTDEKITTGAETLVIAINAVVEFEGEKP